MRRLAWGSAYALAPEDIIAPMQSGYRRLFSQGVDPAPGCLATLLGKVTGVSGGRDANIHGMGDLSLNIVGYISHIPMSMPITLGVAMSLKLRNEAKVAMTYVGDGGSNAGLWHETLNMAALYKVPYVLIVENNQYAYSTHVSDQMPIENIADRAAGYNMPGTIVDGNDVEAVYAATCEAVDRARQGGGTLAHRSQDDADVGPRPFMTAQSMCRRELLAKWERRRTRSPAFRASCWLKR